jgi:hypothetical protein
LPQASALEWLKSDVQSRMELDEMKLELEFRMWLCNIDLFMPTPSSIVFEPIDMRMSME